MKISSNKISFYGVLPQHSKVEEGVAYAKNSNISPSRATTKPDEKRSKEVQRQIYEQMKKLIIANRNTDEPFLDETESFTKQCSKVAELIKLENYIKNDAQLLSCMPKDFDILDCIKFAGTEHIDNSYNFEVRKKALDDLSNFMKNPKNKEISKLYAEDLILGILVNNDNAIEKSSNQAIENLRQILTSNKLSFIKQDKLTFKDAKILLNNQDITDIVSKNIKTLEKINDSATHQSLKELFNSPIKLLTYGGDLNKAFEKLKLIQNSLDKNEKLSCKFIYENSILVIKKEKDMGDNTTQIEERCYDKNMVCTETITSLIKKKPNNTKEVYTTINDLKNRKKYTIKKNYDNNAKRYINNDICETQYNAFNTPIKHRFMKKSTKDNAYLIKELDEHGKIKNISKYSNYNGEKIIEKNLESKDGTKSEYKYKQSQKNNTEELLYVIKDKDNNILAKRKSYTKKISDNLYLSTIDGVNYQISHDKHNVIVWDKTNNKAYTINFKKTFNTVDDNTRMLLKSLPATELIAIANKIKSIKLMPKDKSDSYYTNSSGHLTTVLDQFVLEHEMGHAKNDKGITFDKVILLDSGNMLYKTFTDEKLKEIYLEEKKAYDNSYCETIKGETRYLTGITLNADIDKTIGEAFGETNAIINSPIWYYKLMFRTQQYQENFPRTIAYLMNNYL